MSERIRNHQEKIYNGSDNYHLFLKSELVAYTCKFFSKIQEREYYNIVTDIVCSE